MAIDGGMRKKVVAGLRLTATYRSVRHTAVVIADENGKLRFRLDDGREFKSPSAAGSAVMGGVACNGWRWWSLEDSTAADATTLQREMTGLKPLYRCARCGKQYVGAAQLAHHKANADRLCTPA